MTQTPNLKDAVDAAVGAMNTVTMHPIVRIGPEWLRKAVEEADVLINNVQDAIDSTAHFELTVAATKPPPVWRFAFSSPGLLPLFQYREPQLWLADVLETSGFPSTSYDIVRARADSGEGEALDVEFVLEATESVLRFVCVLLNQHAEQTPSDPTPAASAEQLEATLAGPPVDTTIPRCPNCGERRWSVDGDLVSRGKVRVGGTPHVYVDRAGPEDSTRLEPAGANCDACGFAPGASIDTDPLFQQLAGLAATVVTDGDARGRWTVIYDYREV